MFVTKCVTKWYISKDTIQYKIFYSLEPSGEVWENLKTGGYGIVTVPSTRCLQMFSTKTSNS